MSESEKQAGNKRAPSDHCLRVPDAPIDTLCWCLVALTLVLMVLGLVFLRLTIVRTIVLGALPLILYRQFFDGASKPTGEVSLREVQHQGQVQLLENVISPSEAAHLIRQAQQAELDTPPDPGYRSCSRVFMMGEGVSTMVWERICHLFPPLEVDGATECIDHPVQDAGLWEPIGLNPCWRITRYRPGEHYAPRASGVYRPSDTAPIRSLKTLVIQLSDLPTEANAATNFIHEDHEPEHDEDNRLVAPRSAVLGSVSPVCGMGLAFNHGTVCEDTVLKSGEKWVMFTDIVYRQTSQKPTGTDDPSQALTLYKKAQRMLELKHPEAAHDLYQRARRLSPASIPSLLSGAEPQGA